ncbi:MAG: type I-E CRISPR-associated endonuclease Cas1e [Proteobacteria bacterium]|nr:type I-E CRISPR-associated endonuclease Cas1e [Pseudomonadota bacterium]
MNDFSAPKPIPIKERVSMLFIEKGQLDVLDGAFVVVDAAGVRTHIPIGMVTCLMLEPGARVSHAAVKLAAYVGCLLVWVGEAGVRLYASGQPGGARADRLLYQARLALDETLRLKVVCKMYEMRFGEAPPQHRSINQLRGIEAGRVKALYQQFAKRYGVAWKGRKYDPQSWEASDDINRSLSSATACLYGVTEAAVLAAGYAPAIGFLHTGKPQSFVYDIADILKFDTVVPIAFEVAASPKGPIEREVRHKCRDSFRANKTLQRLIPLIEEVLAAGGIEKPPAHAEALPVAIPEQHGNKDVGHRN